jgi:hypothetical protein
MLTIATISSMCSAIKLNVIGLNVKAPTAGCQDKMATKEEYKKA